MVDWKTALLITLFMTPAEAAGVDKDTIQMVEAFLKKPTAELPPQHVGRFLEIDAKSLPEKLRRPFEAKKLELYTLRSIAGQKKRGFVRMPEEDCGVPNETDTQDAGMLVLAGYTEITQDELLHVIEKTKCTERDLMCEFSLRIAAARDPKTKKAALRYFFHANDPLMALVGVYRSGGKGGRNTPFFGGSTFVCTPHTKKN